MFPLAIEINTKLAEYGHARAHRQACWAALWFAAACIALACTLALLGVLGTAAAALLAAAGAIGALVGLAIHGLMLAERRSPTTPSILAAGPERSELPRAGAARAQEPAPDSRTHDDRAVRDELLPLVSHDLRSALNAMVGWLYLARSPRADATSLQRALDGIASAVDTQRRLVDQLLDAARLLGGRLLLESQPVSPEALFKRAQTRFASRASERSVELWFSPVPEGLSFDGDPGRAEESLAAMIEHAIALTPEHGRVGVGAAQTTASGAGKSVVIEVRGGDGDGDADATPGDASGTVVTGPAAARPVVTLPLAIARAVTGLQGGTLIVETAGQARGVRLSLRFPAGTAGVGAETPTLAQDGATDTPAVAAVAAGTDDDDGRRRAGVLAGCHILMTDDRDDMLDVSATVLRSYGARVTTARSGAETIEQYPNWSRGAGERLLISDLSMPGMDGIALIGRIRRIEGERGLPRLPAVAFSAQADAYSRRTVLQAGFDMFLAKPIQPSQLVDAILPLIGR